jgi:hypothetical protein
MMDKHPHRVMPALGAGTHAFFLHCRQEGMDGRA